MIGKRFTDTFIETRRILALRHARALAEIDIGVMQAALLRALGRSGAATQVTLARATATDESAAARTFTGFARRGWIRRRRGTLDRRESIVELTAAGRRLWRRVEAIHAELSDVIEARLDARDVRDFERICAKLAPLGDEPVATPPRRGRRA